MSDEQVINDLFPVSRGVGVPVRPQPIGSLGVGSGKRVAAVRADMLTLLKDHGIRAVAEILKESDDAGERLRATDILAKYTIGAKTVVEVQSDDVVHAMFALAMKYIPQESWDDFVNDVASAFGMETGAEIISVEPIDDDE